MNVDRWTLNSLFLLLLATGLFACRPVELKNDKFVTYHPAAIYGDGKNGRRDGAFSEVLPAGTYYGVRVQMRRVAGGDDTFVNLRFGPDGDSLQNGRRVYLTNNKVMQETWHFDRINPGEKPLVLTVYNGEVEVLRLQAAHD